MIVSGGQYFQAAGSERPPHPSFSRIFSAPALMKEYARAHRGSDFGWRIIPSSSLLSPEGIQHMACHERPGGAIRCEAQDPLGFLGVGVLLRFETLGAAEGKNIGNVRQSATPGKNAPWPTLKLRATG